MVRPPPGVCSGSSVLRIASVRPRVLELLAKGRTKRRIAKTLFITEKTVSVHVTHILAKLQVTNRSEASARARGHGKAPADGEVTAANDGAGRGTAGKPCITSARCVNPLFSGGSRFRVVLLVSTQGDRDGRADESLIPASGGWFRAGQHPNALASLGPGPRGTAVDPPAASASCEPPGRAGPGRWP
jgi:hypothetical protein